MPLPKGQAAAAPGSLNKYMSLLSGPIAHGMAGMAGYLIGGVHGAMEGVGGVGSIAIGKAALDAVRRTGIARTEDLLTEALLNPELARTLLMKASAENRPFIAQRLTSQLGTLGAVAAESAATNDNRRQSRPVALPAARAVARPAAPAVGLWGGAMVPGGALRGAVR